MSDVLSPDQIAALFEAAKSGSVPEHTPAPVRHGQRIRTVDFSRPTKFNAEHQRRILRAVDTFCLAAGNRMSAELRTSVEFETINSSQVTWTAAQTLVPTHSLTVQLLVKPIERRILMTVERDFMLSAIESLLGGSTDRAPKPRRFSEIDWVLSRRVMDSIVTNLSATWHDLGSLSLELEDLDMESDASAIASVSEPTFVVVLEARLNGLSSTVTLMVPWSALEPVADVIAGKDLIANSEQSDSSFDAVMSHVPVTLRAEVGSVELPISRILALKPGDIVGLGAPASTGVNVFIENTPIGRANPGSHGAHRAVQIAERSGE